MKNRNIPPLFETAWNFAKYNSILRLYPRPLLPRTLVLYVTYRCNSRCFICRLWKIDPVEAIKQEMSIAKLKEIFADPLFAKIEHLNINGGEPTLRNDLYHIVDAAIKILPKLKHITMSSNGLITEKVTAAVEDISKLCHKNKLKYSMSISVHGIDDVLAQVFRVKDAFKRVSKTIKLIKPVLRKNDHTLSINCVLTDINLLGAKQLLSWSKKEGIKAYFVVGEIRERFQNKDEADKIFIGNEKKEYLLKFLKELAGGKKMFNPEAFRYHHLIKMLESNKKRTMSCHYAWGGVVLGAYGEIFYCPHSNNIGNTKFHSARDIYFRRENAAYFNNELIKKECRICPPYTFNKFEFQKDLLKYLRFVLLKKKN